KLSYVKTVESLVNSMCKGVKDGFEKKMKILFAHFPISIEVKGKDIFVKNFLGERAPRKTSLVGDATKLQVKGQSITISGPDKEAVGQTAANLRTITRIKEKDGRIFQDGIYDEM
ncbi:TPA: 50S ribosomal protein L6, partial [Candidatus Micrarchaeota archaeon]|nr:50S ribosomal protein L6 [Candidatus Micrarchaeota archaeon]